MTAASTAFTRGSGHDTRNEILRRAAVLFTEKGFEGTSIKDIADAMGMTKSSLYYHFTNKDAIVLSLFNQRRNDLNELLDWVKQQPRTAELLQRAALRWIDQATAERLDGLRFARANLPVIARLSDGTQNIRIGFDKIIDEILGPSASLEDRLYALMAFDTINTALRLGDQTHTETEMILAAARRGTIALTAEQTTSTQLP